MRVVIADDSILVREGLANLLSSEGHQIVAKVENAEELLDAISHGHTEVALVDIRMPPGYKDEGIRAADEIDKRHPGLGVLILSQYIEPAYAMRLLERRTAGRGYLLKDQIPDVATLLAAITTVATGGSFVDPAVVAPLVNRNPPPDALVELTNRERDILALMAEGRSNSAICSTLFLSPKTVEGYTRTIFQKLGLPPADDDHRRVLAVLRYLRVTAAAG